MQIPKRIPEQRLSHEETVYLTPEGLKRMQERLARLKRELPDAATEAQRTAAYGDRSDNAEYKEAKSALRRNQRQIWNIEDQLKRVQIITAGANDAGSIQLGSTVVLELNDGSRKTFEILGTLETDPRRGRISHKSPLGAALIGHAKGERITITTPGGDRTYAILEIR